MRPCRGKTIFRMRHIRGDEPDYRYLRVGDKYYWEQSVGRFNAHADGTAPYLSFEDYTTRYPSIRVAYTEIK